MISSMVDKPQFPESKPPVTGSTPPQDKKQPSGWEAKPMHWLGMEFTGQQAKQMWNIISQNVGNEIKKEQDRMVKAMKKLNPENNSDDS
jgi:hypothetical protein